MESDLLIEGTMIWVFMNLQTRKTTPEWCIVDCPAPAYRVRSLTETSGLLGTLNAMQQEYQMSIAIHHEDNYAGSVSSNERFSSGGEQPMAKKSRKKPASKKSFRKPSIASLDNDELNNVVGGRKLACDMGRYDRHYPTPVAPPEGWCNNGSSAAKDCHAGLYPAEACVLGRK